MGEKRAKNLCTLESIDSFFSSVLFFINQFQSSHSRHSHWNRSKSSTSLFFLYFVSGAVKSLLLRKRTEKFLNNFFRVVFEIDCSQPNSFFMFYSNFALIVVSLTCARDDLCLFSRSPFLFYFALCFFCVCVAVSIESLLARSRRAWWT